VADAQRALEELSAALGAWRAPAARMETAHRLTAEWTRLVDAATATGPDVPATEAQVIGAVNRAAGSRGVIVCAAGGLPGELSRLWRTRDPQGYLSLPFNHPGCSSRPPGTMGGWRSGAPVGSRAGAVRKAPVSSPRPFERRIQISRTPLSCRLRAKSYATYRAGRAFRHGPGIAPGSQ
jgi:hypothetical protein